MILFLHGEITKQSTSKFLNSIPDEPIEVHIDSPGGDLFEGLKVYNILKNHKHTVEVVVDGVAGSIASVIALSGSKRTISKTGSFMIHNALVPMAKGNHNDLKKIANTLEQYSNIIAGVYADNTKLSHEEALELMNQEQTFIAEDAVKLGFVDSIHEPLKAVAKINEIDMNLLQTIKANLGVETPPVAVDPVVETPAVEAVEGLTPEVEEAVRIIIGEMIAEALAGSPTTEEVGATIATVLNSITSTGSPAQGNGIPAVEVPQEADGISAFNKKMNEIKNQN